MHQIVYHYESPYELEIFLSTNSAVQIQNQQSLSILVQIFAPASAYDMPYIHKSIRKKMPDAVIVGASGAGEVINSINTSEGTVIIFSWFLHTHLFPQFIHCEAGTEEAAGITISQAIAKVDNLKGVLLLTTPHALDVSLMIGGLKTCLDQVPIFGGGASELTSSMSWIWWNDAKIDCGIIAVAFSSKILRISLRSVCGWQPFGKKMQVTSAQSASVITIDNEPAKQKIQQYIGMYNENFYSEFNSIFSFIFEKNGEEICRTPIFQSDRDDVYFLGDVHPGEHFRLGVGNPVEILNHCQTAKKELDAFKPEGIWIYSCGVRRMLLDEDASLETELFAELAPTGGFYTSGEYYSSGNDTNPVLNTSLVIIGLSECEAGVSVDQLSETELHLNEHGNQNIHLINRQTGIIFNLLTFIREITNELEVTNQQLVQFSITDKLTSIFNRAKIEQVLNTEIERAKRYTNDLSVILLDIDNFKAVNDNYGHLSGDRVLIQFADILKHNVRQTDSVGRWGGEEFLIVLPHTNAEAAILVADKLRKMLEACVFEGFDHQTASFGIAKFDANCYAANQLIHHADLALYDAKYSGKNCVRLYDQKNQYQKVKIVLTGNSQLKIGHTLIDSQHHAIFTKLTDMFNYLAGEEENQIQTQSKIESLLKQIKKHTLDEEKILSKIGFPDLDKHIAVHQHMLSHLEKIYHDYKDGTAELEPVLKYLVKDVINDHFMNYDMTYKPYLTNSNKLPGTE